MFRFFICYQFSVLLKLKYFIFQVKYGEIKKEKTLVPLIHSKEAVYRVLKLNSVFSLRLVCEHSILSPSFILSPFILSPSFSFLLSNLQELKP